MAYAPDMLPRTLENLARAVSVSIGMKWSRDEVRDVARALGTCAKEARQEAGASVRPAP